MLNHVVKVGKVISATMDESSSSEFTNMDLQFVLFGLALLFYLAGSPYFRMDYKINVTNIYIIKIINKYRRLSI